MNNGGSGISKPEGPRREDSGTEGAEGVVYATGEGSRKVAVPLQQLCPSPYFLERRSQIYDLWTVVQWALFSVQFSWF